MRILFTDIMQMERLVRQAFVNGLSGFRSAVLVGTANAAGQTNLALFNSLTHIGANPPYLGLLFRPTTVARHTYDNIRRTGQYTINHVPPAMVQQAHQTSAKYPAEISEFDACGFTPQYTPLLSAPYVEESSIKIGLEYVEEYLIEVNDTILLIGKVLEVLLPEAAMLASGHINMEEWGSTAVNGLDTYYSAERLIRLGYARPDQQPESMV